MRLAFFGFTGFSCISKVSVGWKTPVSGSVVVFIRWRTSWCCGGRFRTSTCAGGMLPTTSTHGGSLFILPVAACLMAVCRTRRAVRLSLPMVVSERVDASRCRGEEGS